MKKFANFLLQDLIICGIIQSSDLRFWNLLKVFLKGVRKEVLRKSVFARGMT